MIREAIQADRLAIGHIYCEAWKKAYRGLIPDHFLDALTDEGCAPPAIREGRALVCEEGGLLVGLTHFGAGRDEAYAADGELMSIYVLPESWRGGVGKALFSAARARLTTLGFSRMYLWVLTDNVPARAFYERMGMQPQEERTISIGGAELSETRYELPLSAH